LLITSFRVFAVLVFQDLDRGADAGKQPERSLRTVGTTG
jgi:hypothetical protein